ncbi:50S ribosomal protein L15e [Candidatus Micrarchaeota archaeon]|nr:50S ribosomal protein L15e [Candidatus Micrarchaeota archaeon]MBU1930122.1 50S ribosomal protein L15e [Candidatus Micrarchaeota archaeon]
MSSAGNWIAKTIQSEQKGLKKEGFDYGVLYRNRLIGFRKSSTKIVRVQKPTNLSRARKLGYKAKKGFLIVRVAIRKGSGLHRRPYKGRRPKQMGVNKRTRNKSIQAMAELRVNRKYPNCEVLNSYWVGEDGKQKYFEVILVDVSAPEILKDKSINWITLSVHRGRAARGLTKQAKKSRGQRKKGKGTEKTRPSLRAKKRMAK